MINTYRNKIIQHCISQAWCVWWANFSKFVLSDSSSNHSNLRRYCHFGCTVCLLFHTGHKHIMASSNVTASDRPSHSYLNTPSTGGARSSFPHVVHQSCGIVIAGTLTQCTSCFSAVTCQCHIFFSLKLQHTPESLRCVWCCSRMMVKDMFVHVT